MGESIEGKPERQHKQLEELLTPLLGERIDVIPLTPQEEADYSKALEDSGPRPPFQNANQYSGH